MNKLEGLIYIFLILLNFRGYQQQDAHEFLRYMLDRLHTELMHLLPDGTFKDSPYISLGHKGRSSIVTSVFGGTLQSEVCSLISGSLSKKVIKIFYLKWRHSYQAVLK